MRHLYHHADGREKQMKKINKIFGFLQNNVYYYLCLAAIVLAYGLNIWLNAVLYLLFAVNIIANMRKDRFLYTFFALVIFEAQLHSDLIFSPYMLSSLVKVYYIVFAVRVVMDVIRKTKYKFDWLSTALALIFIATSFAYAPDFSSGASYMIKTAAVVLYMIFYLGANTERDKSVGEMLSVIALFMLLSGVYGVTRNLYWDNRLCSTIKDPNYSAMYFAMGMIASFNATLFKKWFKAFITASLAGLMLMTMSLTGIALTCIVLAVYFMVTQGFKRVILVIGIIAVVIGAVLVIPAKEDSKFDYLKTRVTKAYVIDETDYTFDYGDDFTENERYFNYITNNRYYLVQSYMDEYAELPANQKLFGGNNVIEGDYRDEMVEKYTTVSHNTYIDMMFMIGLVPMAAVTLLLLIRVVQLLREYKKDKSKQVLSLLFVKLIILVFGLTLSFFSYRYFIVFSLI